MHKIKSIRCKRFIAFLILVFFSIVNFQSYNPLYARKKKNKATSVNQAEYQSSKNEYSFLGDLGYEENNPLYFGNPSDAESKLSYETNFLLEKKQFVLSYNSKNLCPNWVAWHLSSSDLGKTMRSNEFLPDDQLPENWYKVKKSDYQFAKYGFERGHMCPSADRTSSVQDNSQTFLMTNMVPQSSDNNGIIWMHFELFERELAEKGYELYIFAGAYGTGGQSSKGYFKNIKVTDYVGRSYYINVPSHTWKIIVAIPEGDNDLERINSKTKVIAIDVPNKMGIAKNADWPDYVCSIDDIEKITGYDFLELLPDEIENIIESKKY